MNPRIIQAKEKKLIGSNIKMSLQGNKTFQLWSMFAPRIKEIQNKIGTDKFSLQIYEATHFKKFNISNEFIKWAAVEVEEFVNIPTGMESFILPGGLYSVFDYKGASNDGSIYRYIYSQWIPKSEYQLDDRPHFEVLGEKYINNDPSSEEEIWIPIK